MLTFYIVFLTPVLLFVLAFLYETWLSFARLKNPSSGKGGYVNATWEVTHTLLVFSVVMLLMTFTQDLVRLADVLFWPTFIAAIALGLRAVAYIYIFYVRHNVKRAGIVDWFFALTHVVAAALLVTVVIKALWFIWQNNPTANTQFFPIFIPGLILVLLVCIAPIMSLYRAK
ncbi:hypothetical protein KDA14_00775 [Candidatus Saccharibacteria bacterium]|nr:hypothetical protein [Candidatus Saccharibacteria bacterium]